MNLSYNGITYFTEKELACKATGVVQLAPGFGDKLVNLRMVYGRPMIVNSCCRSAAHNANVGGNARSLHVYDTPFWPTGGTCAIDISMKDATGRAELVRIALERNWWVDISETFVHLDRRVDYGVADKAGIFLY